MTALFSMLLKSRASPDMLPFSLCNKKRLAIRHMDRPLFPRTLSIPSYDIWNQFGLRTYQHTLVTQYLVLWHVLPCTLQTRIHVAEEVSASVFQNYGYLNMGTTVSSSWTHPEHSSLNKHRCEFIKFNINKIDILPCILSK